MRERLFYQLNLFVLFMEMWFDTHCARATTCSLVVVSGKIVLEASLM